MECVVLAAGYATRLYPLTRNFPKPLLEVQGRTILDHLLDDLGRTGRMDRCAVVTNHRFAPAFSEWARGRAEKVKVLDDGTSSNETRLGAVRDLRFALEALRPQGDVLVMAGDNLLEFSLGVFLDYCEAKGASCVMRYWEPDRLRLVRCGVVLTDADDRILGMTEKSPEPASNWCCPPFYYYKKEAWSMIGAALDGGCSADAPGSLAAWLSARTAVYAMEMPERRYDIGSLQSYEEVRRSYKGASL